MTAVPAQTVALCYVYAHADEELRAALATHLAPLEHKGLITQWHDRDIAPGQPHSQELEQHLASADLVLLLVSADLLTSTIYHTEAFSQVLERQRRNETYVIPIILRAVSWSDEPFGHLQALPFDERPLTQWPDRDVALHDVTLHIRRVIETIQPHAHPKSSTKTPAFWTIPYHRNPFFTNRVETFKQIHKALTTTTTGLHIHAITGLGGIGKTQAVVEYAYRHRYEYQHVLWLTLDSHETLLTDLMQLATRLNLPGKTASDQKTLVHTVQRWLQEERNWLLILDNADNLSIVRDFLPPNLNGHILLTTQARAMGGLAKRVEIEHMGLREGSLLLLRRAGLIASDAPLEHASPADIQVAEAICLQLGGLPLALDQAGAYIEEVSCTLAEYSELYQTNQAALLKRRGDDMNNHPEPIANTLTLSFAKVERANPAAADLLRLCSFLQPDAIPEEIILHGGPDLGPELCALAQTRITFYEALKELQRYSLLHRDPDTKTLTIHRLAQVVIKDTMNAAELKTWQERVVRVFNRVFPNPRNFTSWGLCQRYLADAELCAEMIEMEDMRFASALQLLNRTGYYLMRRGRYDEAATFYQQALTRAPLVFQSDDVTFAETLYRLGELSYIQGRYIEAEPFYQQALQIRTRVLGKQHADVGASYHNLGLLYYEQGKYAEAEQMYQQTLAIWEHVCGPDHPDVAECMNNLAGLYRLQKRYDLAEPLLLRALTIREKVFGNENPDAVLSIDFLAQFYTDLGRDAEAEALLERGLQMCEQVLGPEHPYIAGFWSQQAAYAERRGDYTTAATLLQQAITLNERMLGQTHPYVVRYILRLANIYTLAGNQIAARQRYQQLLSLLEHDTNQLLLATSLEHYATFLHNLKQEAEADALLVRVQAIRLKRGNAI